MIATESPESFVHTLRAISEEGQYRCSGPVREVEAGAAQADIVGHWSTDHRELEATLPYPAGGLNRLHRHGRGRTYKSRQARVWQTAVEAGLLPPMLAEDPSGRGCGEQFDRARYCSRLAPGSRVTVERSARG
jgi:hypothetical protein